MCNVITTIEWQPLRQVHIHIRFDDIRSTAFTQRPSEHPDTNSSVHVFARRMRLWQSVSTVLLLQNVATVRIVYFLRKLSPLLCTLRCLPELLYGMCSALCLHCAFGSLVGVFCNLHCKKKVSSCTSARLAHLPLHFHSSQSFFLNLIRIRNYSYLEMYSYRTCGYILVQYGYINDLLYLMVRGINVCFRDCC